MITLNFSGLYLLKKSAPFSYFLFLMLAFLESISYSMASLIIIPYLNDLGFSDSTSSWLYSCYGIVTTFIGIVCGFFIDLVGIKKSLIAGAIFLTIARFGMALFHNAYLFVFFMIFVLPFGSSMMYPSLLSGVRRSTNEETRSFGFSLFYIIMAIASLCGGFIIDIVRLKVAHHNYCPITSKLIPTPQPQSLYNKNVINNIEITNNLFPLKVSDILTNTNTNSNNMNTSFLIDNALKNSTLIDHKWHEFLNKTGLVVPPPHERVASGIASDAYRVILFITALFNALLLPIVIFFLGSEWNTVEDPKKQGNVRDKFVEIVSAPSFHRLFVLVLLLTAVFQVPRHIEITLPKYLMRIVGCDASFGSIFALNNILIILFIPFATALTTNVHIISCVIIGCFFVSLAPFVFGISSSVALAILHVVILSIGQAFLNPRMNEFSTSIAPIGQEGTYMALSHAPNFLSKIISGLSGNLFEYFCRCHLSTCEPCCLERRVFKDQPCPKGFWIWFVIGLISALATLAIILLSPWLKKEEVKSSFLPAGIESEDENTKLIDNEEDL